MMMVSWNITTSICRYVYVFVGCCLLPFAIVVDLIIDATLLVTPTGALATWLDLRRPVISTVIAAAAWSWVISLTICPLGAGVCMCEHSRDLGDSNLHRKRSLNGLTSAHILVIAVDAVTLVAECCVELVRRHPMVSCFVWCLMVAAIL